MMRDGNDGQFNDPADYDAGDSPMGSRARFEQALGGRPLMVYLVLFAGAGALLVLLMVVWISATGGGDEETPVCLDTTVADARAAILAGEVQRVDIVVDRENPETGPSAVQLEMTDKSCRRLPTGADNSNDAYQLIGIVYVYNSTGDQRIRIHTTRQDVPAEALVTSTPTPSETPTLVPTIPPTDTPVPTETPIPTDTAQPTATFTATVEPTITLPPTQTFAPEETP
jgi:hypothetical protein